MSDFYNENGTSPSVEPEYREYAPMIAKLDRISTTMGKWVWLLFLLIIPNIVAAVVDLFAPSAAVVIRFIVAIVYCYGLLQLGGVDGSFRKAGFMLLAAEVLNLASTLIFGAESTAIVSALIRLAASLLSLYGGLNEFAGYIDVMDGINERLASKWEKLRTWHIISLVAAIASIFIVLLVPLLGAFIIMVAGIIAAVVSILKLVYLYRTATLFRGYNSGKYNIEMIKNYK